MTNKKSVFKSKKLGYASTCILVLLFLLSVFLPLSRTSSNNSNNTSVSAKDQANGVGALPAAQDLGTKDYYYSQATSTATIQTRFPTSGASDFYWGEPGVSTALTTSNFKTGNNTAGTAGSNVTLWSEFSTPSVSFGSGFSGSISTGAGHSAGYVNTSNCTNTTLTTRSGDMVARYNNSAASCYLPSVTVNPSSCAVKTYTATLTTTLWMRWGKTANVNVNSFPATVDSLNWTDIKDGEDYDNLYFGFRLIVSHTIIIHILPSTSKGGDIADPSNTTGVYGTASSCTLDYTQTIDPTETNCKAVFSFMTVEPALPATFTLSSSSAVKTITLYWTAAVLPGAYVVKLKAESPYNSSDKPEKQFTITIKYAMPSTVSFGSSASTWQFTDKTGTEVTPNETTSVIATAKYSNGASAYVKQTFTWAITNTKKNNETITSLPSWMQGNVTGGEFGNGYFFKLIIPYNNVGSYTFTLTAKTTDEDYTLVSESINLTINIVPNVSTISVENIEEPIIAKSYAASCAPDTQKFIAQTIPYSYSSVSPTWAILTILKDGQSFDNSTNIFTVPNGLITWTNGIRSGSYEITVTATYNSIVGSGTCTVDAARPEATWKTPAITYTGKKEFYASNKYDGTSNSNFIANFNEFDDALPPTWQIRNASGEVIENDLLYIGPSGTLNWKAGLAPNNTPVDYSFYVTGTTTTNETPETKAWKDPDDQSAPTYTLIVLHVLLGNVDDVSLTDQSASDLSDIDIKSGAVGDSSYSLQGRVTHADGSDDTRNFAPSLIASGTTENVPDWLDVTTPNTSGVFQISWNGAVKGTYTVKVYLFAEDIDGHDYGYQSIDININVTDFKPNSIVVTGPGSALQAQVDASGISSQTVSSIAYLGDGTTSANVEQGVTWSVSNIKNPAGNPTTSPTITVLPNNTVSWTALPIVGDWTFSLKAMSIVNSTNGIINNVTIHVSPVAPDFFSLDSSSVLLDGSTTKNLEYGQPFLSESPTLVTQYNGHTEWADNTLWDHEYSLVMEQGDSQPAGLTVDDQTGKFSVANNTPRGTYHFHYVLVVTLKSDESELATLDTYPFTLNITKITPNACTIDTQVTNTSLAGYKGWSGETDTSSSWTDGKFTAHLSASGVTANVEDQVAYSIAMTNGETAPSWLSVGPGGEIEWDHPTTDGTFVFTVKAYSVLFPDVDAESTNIYTLSITLGTAPEVVQFNNENEIINSLSNITHAAGQAGSINPLMDAQAVGFSSDPYFQTGIIYSLRNTNGNGLGADKVPSWLHIDATSGVISWDEDWVPGSYSVLIRAESTASESIYDEFLVNINFSVSGTPTNGTSQLTRTIIYIAAASVALIAIIAAIIILSRKRRHLVANRKK